MASERRVQFQPEAFGQSDRAFQRDAVRQLGRITPLLRSERGAQTDAKLGIVTQAWSPIGGVHRYGVKQCETPQDPLAHPTVTGLAQQYDKTPARAVLRRQIDIGHSVIPKPTNSRRIGPIRTVIAGMIDSWCLEMLQERSTANLLARSVR